MGKNIFFYNSNWSRPPFPPPLTFPTQKKIKNGLGFFFWRGECCFFFFVFPVLHSSLLSLSLNIYIRYIYKEIYNFTGQALQIVKIVSFELLTVNEGLMITQVVLLERVQVPQKMTIGIPFGVNELFFYCAREKEKQNTKTCKKTKFGVTQQFKKKYSPLTPSSPQKPPFPVHRCVQLIYLGGSVNYAPPPPPVTPVGEKRVTKK